jgi:hypothetical protein
MADIEREGWLLTILANGVMKGVSPFLFDIAMLYQPSIIFKIRHFRPSCDCHEGTSIRAGFFCQTPNALFAQGRFGKRRRANTNCILAFPQTHMNARFLTLIDRIGQRGTVSSSSCIQQKKQAKMTCFPARKIES